MFRTTFRYLPMLLTVIFTLSPLNPNFSHATSGSDQLARDIDKALRSAEKSIFSGNFQEGSAIMNEIAVKLDELKTTDPDNKKLISISSKFNQLQKKIGQTTPAAASSPPQPQPKTGPKTVTASDKAQGSTDQTISGVAAIAMTGLTGHLDRAEKTMQSGTGDLGKTSLARATDKYQELEKRFPNLINLPEVIAAKQKLDALLIQVEQAGLQQQAAKEKGKNDTQEQRQLIEQWRKTFLSYTMPREPKYLGQHPELLDEAKNVLSEYEKATFPLGHTAEIQSYATDFKETIARTAAEKGAAGIDDQWLPRIKPLLTSNDPAYISPSGPSLHQADEVTRMDGNLVVGKQILDDYAKQFPSGQSTHFLGQAIDDLRRAVEDYQKGRKDAVDRKVAELRGKVDRSLGLLERNKGWTAASSNPIYIINKTDLTEIGKQFEGLKLIPGISADTVAAFDQDIAKVRSLDTEWREKKTAQENAPRPFPAAGMTSLSLVAEMEKILKDRGIGSVDKLVIVDKDWWVQQGEFRYIKAAALQKDSEGPYFTHVTFKQMLTLAGYGRTELWEQGKKIRVAQ
ncbi:MAG: hypothetical protein KJ630_24155 [Proteobacteria bacterium]|nr:hypothetical protein [Pseudomonadota bacterium]